MHSTNKSITFFTSLRNRFQLVLFVLTLAIGLQFFLFVNQAGNGGAMTIPRPAGVEGFLPIGALLGWKHFLATGVWDAVHPAAMVILLYAGVISFLFRKSFCSWFCPVGTLSEWLWKTGHRLLGKNYRLPAALDWPLRSLKVLLLSFFVYVTFSMAPAEIASFLNSPYYKLADVKMLYFFTRVGPLALVIVVGLALLSIPIRNFWCRYVCPYGALMGIISLFSPTVVKRRADTCTNCLTCSQLCPSHLPVHRKSRILSPACSGCMDCISACPSQGTLTFEYPGIKNYALHPTAVAVGVAVIFVAMVLVARFTGHWQGGISDTEFKMLLKMINTPAFMHPSF